MEDLAEIIKEYKDEGYSGPLRINHFLPFRILGDGGTAFVYSAIDPLRTQVFFETETNKLKGKTPEKRKKELREVIQRKTNALEKNICTFIENEVLHKYLQFAAVKILKPERAANPEIVKRFEKEWKTLYEFDSEKVVKVFEGGHDLAQGFNYYAMEIVDGISPGYFLYTKDNEKFEYFIQACLCMEELHTNHIVHRDVKEDNFLSSFDKEGKIKVKIADLGFIKDYLNHESLTKTGYIVGTPEYMSPDQILDFKHLDPRGDIYSMGIILYHLFTKRYPFEVGEDEPASEFVARVINDKPVLPSDYNPDINKDLEKVIIKATHKDVKKRYQHMSQLREDVEEIRNSV
jgi:serine/threonine-protein kinase